MAEAVEAHTLLVSVKGIPTTCNRFPLQHPIVHDQQFRFGIIVDSENVSWELQFPSRLNKPPACLNLCGQIPILELLGQSKQILSKPNALLAAIPLVGEEANANLSVVNDMECINYIVEAQLGRNIE